MTTHVSDNAQIEHMEPRDLTGILDRMTPLQMRDALAFISGYCPATFAAAIKRDDSVCGVQADDDNWCILPKGHAESHCAGEFTWDVWEETPEMHTIASA